MCEEELLKKGLSEEDLRAVNGGWFDYGVDVGDHVICTRGIEWEITCYMNIDLFIGKVAGPVPDKWKDWVAAIDAEHVYLRRNDIVKNLGHN